MDLNCQQIKWACFLLLALPVFFFANELLKPFGESHDTADSLSQQPPRNLSIDGKLTLWWEKVPENLQKSGFQSGTKSNIHRSDYAGPESCKKCHPKNYSDWLNHAHHRMNELATEETVEGDFSGNATIEYLGGVATFFREEDAYRMRLERDKNRLVYQITQTIGSRFFQYYIGKLLKTSSPTFLDEVYYREDHVLPFGYWLTRGEWVPLVHVDRKEFPDGERFDPFELSPIAEQESGYVAYSRSCNYCHTTFPLGDMLMRYPEVVGKFSPVSMHWSMAGYLAETHPDVWDPKGQPENLPNDMLTSLMNEVLSFEAPEHAVSLGISCEACHLGAKEHAAAGKERLPEFFPRSPHLFLEADEDSFDFSRSSANVNWICGRCHTGHRSQLAAGMATWNSTEYSDAMRGSCYSKLTCVECHNPHQAIGQQWTLTPAQDDALCMGCHQKYRSDDQRLAHTHHQVDSPGSRCMNCHMPRITEGLQDVVRTHMIFSPTQKDMIEANHPNACNLCHIEKSINWTLASLKDWYGKTYSKLALQSHYTDQTQPTGLGWLESDREPVRLVAADALTRAEASWALPQIIDALDDPYLLNRQFARMGLEKMLGIRLQDFGYRFYMMPDERRGPLGKLREALLNKQKSKSK